MGINAETAAKIQANSGKPNPDLDAYLANAPSGKGAKAGKRAKTPRHYEPMDVPAPVVTPRPNPIDVATDSGAKAKRREIVTYPFLPPSWNAMTGGHHQVAMRRKMAHKELVAWTMKGLEIKPFPGPVFLTWIVYRPDAHQCDGDNVCIKYMQDAFVSAGIFLRDTSDWVKAFQPEVLEGPANIRCTRLIIEEM